MPKETEREKISPIVTKKISTLFISLGDATLVLPAQNLYVETIRQVKKISAKIARALQITGPFNIQYISKQNEVKVKKIFNVISQYFLFT